MKLNPQQVNAVEGITEGVLGGSFGYTLLGEGGTGKTTCIMEVVKRLQAHGKRVLLTAPTNQAVSRLQLSADSQKVHAVCATTHKALGLALLPDEENKFAAKLGKGLLSEFDAVVVDEGSMLSSRATSILVSMAEDNFCSLIIMGDKMQLPPVREQKSPALEILPIFELTKVERQDSGSSIIKFNSQLRHSITTRTKFEPECVSDNGTVFVKSALFDSLILDKFTLDCDLDSQRVLCWTNDRVNTLNDKIRKSMYGTAVPTYIVGERVATGESVIEEGESVIPSSCECTINNISEGVLTCRVTSLKFAIYEILVTPISTEFPAAFINVLHESSVEDFKNMLSDLAKEAREVPRYEAKKFWKRYHEAKDQVNTLKYCYAMTVHRSQGSTYDEVFVDVDNIMRNKNPIEARKLLYVACSRPRSRLYLSKSQVRI